MSDEQNNPDPPKRGRPKSTPLATAPTAEDEVLSRLRALEDENARLKATLATVQAGPPAPVRAAAHVHEVDEATAAHNLALKHELRAVKTKYQLGREIYESENPEADFGTLTESEQAPYVARGVKKHG